jgi:hypothetical protein
MQRLFVVHYGIGNLVLETKELIDALQSFVKLTNNFFEVKLLCLLLH